MKKANVAITGIFFFLSLAGLAQAAAPSIQCRIEQELIKGPNDSDYLGIADSGHMQANHQYDLRLNGYILHARLNDENSGNEGGGNTHVYSLDIKMEGNGTSVSSTIFQGFGGYNFDYLAGNKRSMIRCFDFSLQE